MGRPWVAPEREVQATFLAILRARGIWCFRCNSGRAVGTAPDGRRFALPMAPAGTADILGHLADGRLIGVEVKREGGRPTEAQYAWMRERNASGAVAFWCDRAEYLEKILDWLEAGHSVAIDAAGEVALVRGRGVVAI